MANAKRVNVGDGPEALVGVQFDEKQRHLLLDLVVMLYHAEHSLRDVLHDDIQIYFIFLK